MKCDGYMLFVGADLEDAINNGVIALTPLSKMYDTPEEALKLGNSKDWYPGRCVARRVILGEPLVLEEIITAKPVVLGKK